MTPAELFLDVRVFSKARNKGEEALLHDMDEKAKTFIIGQVSSELTELAQSHIDINEKGMPQVLLEQIDAAVDAMYYIADTCAMHRFEPAGYVLEEGHDFAICAMTPDAVKSFNKAISLQIAKLYSSTDLQMSQDILWNLFIDIRNKFINNTNIDVFDYFGIVHAANMTKLNPDGTPKKIRESDGKVLKPDDFVPPDGLMRELLDKQLQERNG